MARRFMMAFRVIILLRFPEGSRVPSYRLRALKTYDAFLDRETQQRIPRPKMPPSIRQPHSSIGWVYYEELASSRTTEESPPTKREPHKLRGIPKPPTRHRRSMLGPDHATSLLPKRVVSPGRASALCVRYAPLVKGMIRNPFEECPIVDRAADANRASMILPGSTVFAHPSSGIRK